MFDTLISDTHRFVEALAQDNTRDWFHANKSTYDSKLRDPAKALLEELAPRLQDLTGFPVTSKLFRPNRDVRFSKDKTPYKTHLHMMWMVDTGARQDPALFFGINAAQVTVATGMMEFSKEVLADWRKMVDLDGAYVSERIKSATDKGYTYGTWEKSLKRVPPPFDKDHPHGDLLKQKGLIITGQPDLSGDLPSALFSAYADIWPVSDMLVGIAETPTL
ncbi:MAG: DUF2461 domain-containing protein [Pseudomonadota bacterium]